MTEVTVSPKYQIVIPKEVRTALKIKPGTKLTVVADGATITYAKQQPLTALRGILRGGPGFEREPDRVL